MKTNYTPQHGPASLMLKSSLLRLRTTLMACAFGFCGITSFAGVGMTTDDVSYAVPLNGTVNFTDRDFKYALHGASGTLNYIVITTLPYSGQLLFDGSPVNIGDYVGIVNLSKLSYVSQSSVAVLDSASYVAYDGDGNPTDNVAQIRLSTVDGHFPTGLTISSTQALEQQPAGTTIGFLTGIDPDIMDSSFTYELVEGPHNDDNWYFQIDHNKLQVAQYFDYASFQQFTLGIKVTDPSGLSVDMDLPIEVKYGSPTISGDLLYSVTGGITKYFNANDFNSKFSSPISNRYLTTAKIATVPSFGTLSVNGTTVNAGDILSYGDLWSLVYDTPLDSSGTTNFTWLAGDNNGHYSDNTASVFFEVIKKRAVLSSEDVVLANGADPGSGVTGRVQVNADDITMDSTIAGSGDVRNGSGGSSGGTNGSNKTAGIADAATASLTSNCYPNPFSQNITIQYDLPAEAKVNVRVYNLLGMEVASLVNASQTAGTYKINWNGNSNMGTPIETGNYFYKVLVQDASGKVINTFNGRMVKM